MTGDPRAAAPETGPGAAAPGSDPEAASPGAGAAHGEALAAARALIARLKQERRHHVACSVLTAAARYTACNLESTLPSASICAEAVAIGMASVAEPGAPILFSVAVNRRGEVIPPCGFCRELLTDYGPNAQVGVGEAGGALRLATVRALLPDAYKGHLRG